MRMIGDTAARLRRSGVRERGTVFNQLEERSADGYRYGYGQYGGHY